MSEDSKEICPYCLQTVNHLERLEIPDEYLGLVSNYSCEDCANFIELDDLDFENFVGNYDPE